MHLLTLQVALVQGKARLAVGRAEGEVGGEAAAALPRVGKVLDCPPPSGSPRFARGTEPRAR
jgi:hypothetical protein